MNTAVEIAAAVRDGRLSARAAVEASLQTIADHDESIGAFQEVRAMRSLREADAVDAIADKSDLPLAGVPVAIKDNVAVEGEPMRKGSLATSDAPQPHDDEVVRRLRAAGAVVVGTTRVPELCIWPNTDSQFGVTRNPWNPSRTPGGSSGGSAAAVAAGMVPIALGNDGLGSVRIPAACCGLVGIKPGHGLVPVDLDGGDWFELVEHGPLATTAADAALMLSVLGDRPDLARLREPATSLRVATSTKTPLPYTPVDTHWAAAVDETGTLLRELGHPVRRADLPYDPRMAIDMSNRWLAGVADKMDDIVAPSRLSRRTRAHARAGRAVAALGLPREKSRQRWIRRAEHFFRDFDVLVTPTLAQPPSLASGWAGRGWTINAWTATHLAPFTGQWNVAQWPAIAVPAGLDPDGLPLSVQLVAKPGMESTLLGLAAALERVRPWPRTAPVGLAAG